MNEKNNSTQNEDTVFFTLVKSERGLNHARFLIESLRTFGGSLSAQPVWVFLSDPISVSHPDIQLEGVQFRTIEVEEKIRSYFFAEKVYASALAESIANHRVHSLVWLSTN